MAKLNDVIKMVGEQYTECAQFLDIPSPHDITVDFYEGEDFTAAAYSYSHPYNEKQLQGFTFGTIWDLQSIRVAILKEFTELIYKRNIELWEKNNPKE